ncbi:MAG: hypothetical protein PVJ09_00840 [Candidatus Woesebacteria bacterium]|jgi:outer membrane murein-binding lipoprotein Lpp
MSEELRTAEQQTKMLPKELRGVMNETEIRRREDVGVNLYLESAVAKHFTTASEQLETLLADLETDMQGPIHSWVNNLREHTKEGREWVIRGGARKERKAQREYLDQLESAKAVSEGTGAWAPHVADSQEEENQFVSANTTQNEMFATAIEAQKKAVTAAEARLDAAKKAWKNTAVWRATLRVPGETIGHAGEKAEAKKLKAALEAIIKAENDLPLLNAALVATADRIIAQADGPLPEGVLKRMEEFSALLKKVEDATAKLAVAVDKAVNSRVISRSTKEKLTQQRESRGGNFAAVVEGEHAREALLVDDRKRESLEAARKEVETIPPAAIKAAGDKMRFLVEQQGRLKRQLPDHCLTADALAAYEKERAGSFKDPFRRAAFNRVNRQSVDTLLGCQVRVSREGDQRNVDFTLSVDQEAFEASLFRELAECAAVEQVLRAELKKLDPKDLTEVRAITAALQENYDLEQSLLKMADARINGARFWGGVRTGEIKTSLAENTVKVTEALMLAAVVLAALSIAGHLSIDKANAIMTDIAEAPEKIDALQAQLSEVTAELGIKQTELESAVRGGVDAVARTVAEQKEVLSAGAADIAADKLALREMMETGAREAESWRTAGNTILVFAKVAAVSSGLAMLLDKPRAAVGDVTARAGSAIAARAGAGRAVLPG